MAGVRDPAFWKRFSTAVHLDEEGGYGKLEDNDSWLARQQRKKSRRRYVCPIFWACFFLFIAGAIAVVIWLLKSGILDGIHLGNGEGTPNQPANPNGGRMGQSEENKLKLVRRVLDGMLR